MPGFPTDNHIDWRPLDEILQRSAGGAGKLPGFDEEFDGLVDYVLKITHRIWEEKNIGLCYRYYAEHCPVHTLNGYSDTVEEVVQGTLKTVAAFPDRILIGENVVWSQDQDHTFYSSHRITSAMTNSGASEFGPATGRSGRVTTIADCVCENNQVVYEWLMRDNSFLVKQLGLNPLDVAVHMARVEANPRHGEWWQAEFDRVRAKEAGTNTGQASALAEAWVERLFNQKMFGEIPRLYRADARVEWPGGRHVIGHRGTSGTFIQWLAQFPDARVSCDHVALTPFNDKVTDIAIRWTLAGHFNAREASMARYSGLPSLVLGATHLRVEQDRIVQEWTVFDELALMVNLHRSYGKAQNHG